MQSENVGKCKVRYFYCQTQQPHVIDEWQLAPAIWNTVRHAVDRKRGLRGAWLLTGSSTPLAKDEDQARAMHSGAGRIGRIRMHPMSLAESGDSTGQVSLAALFRGEFARATVPGDAGLPCRCGVPRWLARDVGSFPEPISSHRKGVPEPIVLGKRPAPRPRRRFGTAHRAFPSRETWGRQQLTRRFSRTYRAAMSP